MKRQHRLRCRCGGACRAREAVGGGQFRVTLQGAADGARDGFAHRDAIVEAHFLLGRMHIDVKALGFHLQEKEGHRVLPLHEQGVKALAKAVIDGRALDRPTVEEGQLLLTAGAAQAGTADVAVDADALMIEESHLEQALGEFIAHQSADAFKPIRGGGQMEGGCAVANEGEGDAGMGNGMQAELLLDVGIFSRLGAQELAAGRHVEKERTCLNHRARCAAVVAHMREFAAVNFDLGAGKGGRFAGCQAKARDAGNARQGLTAEAKAADGGEVLLGANLACCMPFDAKQGILAPHAAAVVGDSNQSRSAALHLDGDLRCTGIETVLDQLTDHGGRTLDHLAGGHLAGQSIRKNADF